MIVSHPFVSALPDGPDATLVRPSNWNAVHTATIEAADGGTLIALQKSRRTAFEEFEQSGDSILFASVVAGVGSNADVGIAALAGQIGVRQLTTGTDTTGRAALRTNVDLYRPGNGAVIYEQDLNIPVLSTAAEEFIVRLGLVDSTTSDGTDGAFFKYDRLGLGANWQAVNIAGAVSTTVDTGVAVTAGTFINFRVVVNAAASSAEYFIAGVSRAVIATNVPTAPTGLLMGINKSAGTTARTMQTDFVFYDIALTTAR